MKRKTIVLLIVILALLTCINVGTVAALSYAENLPKNAYTVEVLGAVFKEETESNVVDINLVIPPRVAVTPGEIVETGSYITNTFDKNTRMRANYRIDIIDAGGNQVEEYQDFVIVNLNDGWVVKENYIYYEDTIEPGEEIPGPIESIEYLEEFANTRDWDVYIPVLIECAEDVDEIRWPNQDIERINIKDWINYDATWTQSVMIKMS